MSKRPKPIPLLDSVRGLNNRDDPARLAPEDLAVAFNVDIEPTGRVSRRRGYSQISATPTHSLWSADGASAYYVADGDLYRLGQDLASTLLRSGLVSRPMAYVKVGRTVFFSNGSQTGLVDPQGKAGDWSAGAYVGPENMRSFSSPPAGHLLAFHGGRVLIAVGRYLYYTEPFAYHWVDLAANYQAFDSRLTMVQPVKDGVFVSSETRTHFLAGEDVVTAKRSTVASYPAIAGSAVLSEGNRIGELELSHPAALWTTAQGLCIGTAQGEFHNLTDERLVLPATRHGAATIHRRRYLCSLEE